LSALLIAVIFEASRKWVAATAAVNTDSESAKVFLDVESGHA
jgi:hypothetical protein